ncbi:MAG: radical SAM protein [Planctomycetes bacterium]|nr:radical SAM protein [Planctomycetota bacterium]
MNEHGQPAPQDGLASALAREAYERCIPLNATVELTLRCNIRCVHCYNFDRERPPAPDAMTFDDWRRVFREMRDEGTLYLGFSGGEAMTHPRFWDLMDEASSLRFAITLLTNGTLLAEAACDRLAAYPTLAGVAVSAYGAAPGTHDAITRVRGSWERTLRGAERMRARGVFVTLKFILMKGNARETGAMIDLASKMGLSFQVDGTITGRYDGTAGSLAERVDVATLAGLYRGPLRPHLSKRKADPTDDEFKCNCARATCAIFASGGVSPCIAVPLFAGNVRERSFGGIWRDSDLFRRIRALRIEDFRSCAPCPLKAWCRRSPGPPSALHGDFTGIDPWVCDEAAAIRDVLEASPPRSSP